MLLRVPIALVVLLFWSLQFGSGSAFAQTKELVGVLAQSPSTKGGVGFDDCLGSPFFYLGDISELANSRLKLSSKLNDSYSEFEKLIGRKVQLKVKLIDQTVDLNKHWAPKSKEEQALQRPLYPGLDDKSAIGRCRYYEVIDFKLATG